MIQVDTVTLAVLVVVLGALVVLGGVVVDWRGVMKSDQTLAVWGFLGRQGFSRETVAARAGQRALRIAEMRCATCSSQVECAKHLAAGADSPGADCPNLALFASLK
jgi:hypothetical protein